MKKIFIILSCISTISSGASLSPENSAPKEVNKSTPSPKTPTETRRSRTQAFIHNTQSPKTPTGTRRSRTQAFIHNAPQPTTVPTHPSLLTQTLRDHGIIGNKQASQHFEQDSLSLTSENDNPQQPTTAPAQARSSIPLKSIPMHRNNKNPKEESLHNELIPKWGQIPDSEYESFDSSPLESY